MIQRNNKKEAQKETQIQRKPELQRYKGLLESLRKGIRDRTEQRK